MNNIEAYNTESGNGAPFETLETFQDTAVPPVAPPAVPTPTPQAPQAPQATGGSPMCTNGYGPNREGLCEDGATPSCMTGETLNATSGMCEVAAANPSTAPTPPATMDQTDPQTSPNTTAAAPDPTAVTAPVEDPAVTPPTPPVETFIGGGSLDMDLLLRALVFGCLFFILAHNDTRKMLVNSSVLRSLNLKAGDDNSLLILMGVFVIAYLVLTRYVL